MRQFQITTKIYAKDEHVKLKEHADRVKTHHIVQQLLTVSLNYVVFDDDEVAQKQTDDLEREKD